MYNCELFSVQKNSADVQMLSESIDNIAHAIYKSDIRVLFKTDIDATEKAFTKVLKTSDKSGDEIDYNIFVNALDTTDSSSFKSLFYNFIKSAEASLPKNEENSALTPKIKISTIKDLGNGYNGYCFKIFSKHYVVLPLASLTGVEIEALVTDAINKAQSIFKQNEESCPDGIAYIEKPALPQVKKKEGFFMSFIPHKGDSKNNVIRKIVVLLAIIAFIVSAAYLINEFAIKPYLNSQITSEIHDIAYNTTTDSGDDTTPETQNWEALKKLNKEIVAWITLKGTKIDYPVLEHKGDNAYSQYYLNRTYKKSYSSYGSVFVDYRSTDSVKSKNVILHGHNIRDGSMFNALMGYGDLKGNLNFYKKHPIIEFNTPEANGQYKIISVFKTSTYYDHDDGKFFNYMQGSFLSDAEFMNYVYNVRIRSLINCPVMVNEDDQLLTLSTCSYEFTGFRTVVVARKLRDGEKATVNTEIATVNSAAVFPACYYQRYGGSKPEILTFKKAYSKGLINWYDGAGNLEGSEELTETVKSNPTEDPSNPGEVGGGGLINYYEVKFVNHDGSEYYTLSVKEGDSVTPPGGTPTLPKDDYYDYTFTGWLTDGLDLNNVHYSMTIYPNFTATLKPPKTQ